MINWTKPIENIYGDWKPIMRTAEQQRCQDIKKQLQKNNITAEVSRHHINNWLFYDIEIPTTNENYIGETEISKALRIDEKYVHFIHIDLENEYKIIWVEEKQLHKQHLTADGRLNFNTKDKMKEYALYYINNEEYVVTEIKEENGGVTVELIRTKYV